MLSLSFVSLVRIFSLSVVWDWEKFLGTYQNFNQFYSTSNSSNCHCIVIHEHSFVDISDDLDCQLFEGKVTNWSHDT